MQFATLAARTLNTTIEKYKFEFMATRASSTLGSRLVLSTFYDILCKLRSGKTASNVREAERQVDVSLISNYQETIVLSA